MCDTAGYHQKPRSFLPLRSVDRQPSKNAPTAWMASMPPNPIARPTVASQAHAQDAISHSKRTFSESESDSEEEKLSNKKRVMDWTTHAAASRKRSREVDMQETGEYKRLHMEKEMDMLPHKLKQVQLDDPLPTIDEEPSREEFGAFTIVDLETGETLSPVSVLDAESGALVPYSKRTSAFPTLKASLDDTLTIPVVPSFLHRDAVYGAQEGWQMVLYEPPLGLEDLAKGTMRRREPSGYIYELEEDEEELADATGGYVEDPDEPFYTVVEPKEEDEEDVVNRLAKMDLD